MPHRNVACRLTLMAPHAFHDRTDAGRTLARLLARHANRPDAVVLALPRGGVPVGFEVAQALHLPLDVFVVRKLGVPGDEEHAMGALASGGVRVLDGRIVRAAGISDAAVEAIVHAEAQELERRERLYRHGLPPPSVQGRTVILVDDGLATGSTMRAAVKALRRKKPERIVVAVPTGAPSTCEALRRQADEVVCAMVPDEFGGVSLWYEHFEQTSDEDVLALLARARNPAGL